MGVGDREVVVGWGFEALSEKALLSTLTPTLSLSIGDEMVRTNTMESSPKSSDTESVWA